MYFKTAIYKGLLYRAGPCGVLQECIMHYLLCIMYIHLEYNLNIQWYIMYIALCSCMGLCGVHLLYIIQLYNVYCTVFLHGSLPSWEPKSIVLLLLPPKPGEAPNLPKHTTEIGFLFTLVIAPHKYRSFWISLFQAFVKYQALLYHQNSTRSW